MKKNLKLKNIKSKLSKYVIEAFLIIFSVVLGLFLNEIRENYNHGKETKRGLKNIEKEIFSNNKVLQNWIPYHRNVLKNIDSIIQLETYPDKLITAYGLNIFVFAPEGVFNQNLNDTSWRVSNDIGITNKIDYETIHVLSGIYDLQENSVKRTIEEILVIMFANESQMRENLRPTLVQLYTRFKILVELEASLHSQYQKGINHLEKLNGN